MKFPGPIDPAELPEWLRPGSIVVHSKYGNGVIQGYRIIKNGPAMEIDFDVGTKILNPEHGIPHLRPVSHLDDK